MLGLALLLACAAAYYADHVYRAKDFSTDDAEMIVMLLMAAGACVGVSRKMMAPSAEQLLAKDARDPVVYLRPFDEDSRRTEYYPVGRRNGGRPISRDSIPASNEKILARALKQIGPFVAVGMPGDILAPLGAARIYLADDKWQAEVESLVRRASAIILVPETTQGTRWEVNKVAQWADPRRVLMIVPNPASRPLGYARIQTLSAEELAVPFPKDCSNVNAFMFDEDRRPRPIVFGRNVKAALEPFVAQVRLLSGAGAP